MGTITAFNRRRDSYQVPIALAEANDLDAFVTDYYHSVSWPRLSSLAHRQSGSISRTDVRVSPATFWAQLGWELARKFRRGTPFPSRLVDPVLGRAVQRVGRAMPSSDLLIYSGYAAEAFSDRLHSTRTLFLYHPRPNLVRSLLNSDEMANSARWLREPEVQLHPSPRAEAEVEYATGFIVASSTSARSLVVDGVKSSAIRIVPYGCNPATRPPQPPAQATQEFLFVGQGTQRKGLHLLLTAWESAKLSRARLTIATMRFDPAIEALAKTAKNVRIAFGLSHSELAHLYKSADSLILPSLVEGFGLVLLEGLANGTRLIASDATAAVDLNLPPHICAVVPAGQVEALRTSIQESNQSYIPSRPYAREAWTLAHCRSWGQFRRNIRGAATELQMET